MQDVFVYLDIIKLSGCVFMFVSRIGVGTQYIEDMDKLYSVI